MPSKITQLYIYGIYYTYKAVDASFVIMGSNCRYKCDFEYRAKRRQSKFSASTNLTETKIFHPTLTRKNGSNLTAEEELFQSRRFENLRGLKTGGRGIVKRKESNLEGNGSNCYCRFLIKREKVMREASLADS